MNTQTRRHRLCLLVFTFLTFSPLLMAADGDETCAKLFEIKNAQSFLNDAPNALLRTKLQYFITAEGESIAILKLDAKQTPKSTKDFDRFVSKEALKDIIPSLNEVTTFHYPIHEIREQSRHIRFLSSLPIATAPWIVLIATDIALLTPIRYSLNIPPEQLSFPMIGVVNVVGAGVGLVWFLSQMYDLGMSGIQDSYIQADDPRVKKLAYEKLTNYFRNENEKSKAQGLSKPKLLVINGRDIPKYFTENSNFARTDLVNFIVQSASSDSLNSRSIFSSSMEHPIELNLSSNYMAPVYSLRIKQIDTKDKDTIVGLQDFFELSYTKTTIEQEISKLNQNPVYAVYAQNMDTPAAIFQWILNEKKQVIRIRYLEKEFIVDDKNPQELFEKILKTLGFQAEEIQTILKDYLAFLEDKKSEKKRTHLLETATRIQNML